MTNSRRESDVERAALRVLGSLGSTQGFDVVARLARGAEGAGVSHAQAYSVLYTLESRGLIEGRLEPSADGGERRWYSLTTRGHRALSKLQASEAVGEGAVPAVVTGGSV